MVSPCKTLWELRRGTSHGCRNWSFWQFVQDSCRGVCMAGGLPALWSTRQLGLDWRRLGTRPLHLQSGSPYPVTGFSQFQLAIHTSRSLSRALSLLVVVTKPWSIWIWHALLQKTAANPFPELLTCPRCCTCLQPWLRSLPGKEISTFWGTCMKCICWMCLLKGCIQPLPQNWRSNLS